MLQTGVGVTALAQEAERLGRKADLVGGLAVGRYPEPRTQAGVGAGRARPSPHPLHRFAHTTAELLALSEPLSLQAVGVGVVHYGERNDAADGRRCGSRKPTWRS